MKIMSEISKKVFLVCFDDLENNRNTLGPDQNFSGWKSFTKKKCSHSYVV